jgi:hypothetical protein
MRRRASGGGNVLYICERRGWSHPWRAQSDGKDVWEHAEKYQETRSGAVEVQREGGAA